MTTINAVADNLIGSNEKDRRYISLWSEVMRTGLVAAAKSFLKTEDTLDNRRDYHWLMNEEDKGPGSINWICDVLDLSPDYVRAKWRENVRVIVRTDRNGHLRRESNAI